MPAAYPAGTRVEVRDLFFATPARLKFLKTPRTERDLALDTVRRLAMAYPGIAFTVTGDLTFHGVTRPISFKLTRTGSGKDFKGKPIAGFEAPFWIKRSEFKMSNMIGPVADDVLLTVSVEGAQ